MTDPYADLEMTRLSPVRRIISRTMTASQAIPQFRLFRVVGMDQLIATRSSIPEKPTITSCLLRLLSRILVEDGRLNGIFRDEHCGLSKPVHLSVAMAGPAGLIVPVVRDSDRLSALLIHQELIHLNDAIVKKSLSPDRLVGGTFTFTNLGMYGVDRFLPLLNPPQIGILAAGRLRDHCESGSTYSKVIEFTLSADHRAVDGAEGAEFLERFAEKVESCSTEDLN